ncbi:hypothetical protein P43SY_000643 [Pythium insidiosum]|uniref:PH domain-containing protein n=1 Tax=Pythium insidiosum TaxID=114742 RepID=A0AAD5MDX6_PYTIN|nr:hypothetical protein P43SY_000643 [Pythium insidiosum]
MFSISMTPAPTESEPAASAPTRGWRHHLRLHHAFRPHASPSPDSRAAAQGDALKQGWLLKKGHRLPTQKDRFFVLRPQLLSYFRSETQERASLRGVVQLSPTDLVTPVATSRHWFLISQVQGYKLELRASSPEERQAWIEACRAACRAPSAPALDPRTAERERQLTRTFTMLRQQAPQADRSALGSSASVADLRASFQVFHELVMLQALVATIQSDWGPPETWSCDQYDELVQSIQLAKEKAGGASADAEPSDSLLGIACALRYAFEVVPENQVKLMSRQSQQNESSPQVHDAIVPGARVRCPTIYSYFSTFERLSLGVRDSSNSTDLPLVDERGSATAVSSARSSGTAESPLTPRSATLAKYAHMYLEEEGRHRAPWSWERTDGDDLLEQSKDSAASRLAERFDQDRVYSYLGDRTLLFTNPNRVLKTTKFTSIYDEHVVLVYDQTPFATTTRKIERTLRKYQDRLDDLRARIVDKKREKAYIADMSKGIGAFMTSSSGGLEASLWEDVLRDPDVQRLLQQDNCVVIALREVSLNPDALVKQLSNPLLREFYDRVLQLLQSKQAAEAVQSSADSDDLQHSLEDRIRVLAAKRKTLWIEAAQQEAWAEIQDRLEEICEEPEMLLFYQDDTTFMQQISVFVRQVESAASSDVPGASTSELEERRQATATLMQRLAKVEFNASLMAAMQGDPFFVEALQAPETVTAVHQFMTDRDAFAAKSHGDLTPVVFDFFSRLVALAAVVQRRM